MTSYTATSALTSRVPTPSDPDRLHILPPTPQASVTAEVTLNADGSISSAVYVGEMVDDIRQPLGGLVLEAEVDTTSHLPRFRALTTGLFNIYVSVNCPSSIGGLLSLRANSRQGPPDARLSLPLAGQLAYGNLIAPLQAGRSEIVTVLRVDDTAPPHTLVLSLTATQLTT